jgi:hypothetical protein
VPKENLFALRINPKVKLCFFPGGGGGTRVGEHGLVGPQAGERGGGGGIAV